MEGVPAKRPISVIILQFVLVIAIAIYIGGYVYGIYKATGRFLPPHPPTLSLLPVLFMGYVSWVLAMRKSYGRWLGLFCIFALLAMEIYQVSHKGSGSSGPQSDQALGAMFGEGITVIIVFAWWLYSLGFSAKAKAFFATSGMKVESAESSGSGGDMGER